MWLMATELENFIEHFHHCRTFCWADVCTVVMLKYFQAWSMGQYFGGNSPFLGSSQFGFFIYLTKYFPCLFNNFKSPIYRILYPLVLTFLPSRMTQSELLPSS